jgi:hypothetical protein
MILNENFLLLIAVASVCFGFFAGYVLRSFFQKGDPSDAPIESDQILDEDTDSEKSSHRNWQEVANLWRDRQNGKLIFQIDTEHYMHGEDLSTRERELLRSIGRDLNRWLDPAQAAQQQDEQPAQSIPTRDNYPTVETKQKIQAFEKPQKVNRNTHEKPLHLDMRPVNILASALEMDIKQPSVSEQSMVTQVDAILQEKLPLAGIKKGAIRLTEFPQSGMVVWVGLEQYNGIDEVPYKRVRSIIRESVSEWENRAVAANFLQ